MEKKTSSRLVETSESHLPCAKSPLNDTPGHTVSFVVPLLSLVVGVGDRSEKVWPQGIPTVPEKQPSIPGSLCLLANRGQMAAAWPSCHKICDETLMVTDNLAIDGSITFPAKINMVFIGRDGNAGAINYPNDLGDIV